MLRLKPSIFIIVLVVLTTACAPATPSSTPTRPPTASFTAAARPTATATPSPTSTVTPEPTDTPTPTYTPLPTDTPTPIPTRKPLPSVPPPTPTIAGPDVSSWNPRPIRIDCLRSDFCGFVFTITFSAEGFHHRLEFMDDAGNSIVLGIGSTFQDYVALSMWPDLRNLQQGVPYRWRVRLYQATSSGEVFLKASEWAKERYVRT
jgi:hypothetical protein